MHEYKLISLAGLIICSNSLGSQNKLPKVIEETSTHTLTREENSGKIVTRVTGPSKRTERLTPIIYVDNKMVIELGAMIKDRSSELYHKKLPSIKMNVGTRVFQEESDSPGFGTSISFPL